MDHYGEWKKIESVVDQALELEPDQRISFIREQCGDNNRMFKKVLELIEAIESSDGYLEETMHEHISLIKEWTEISAPKESSFIRKTIGQYKITRLIEHGGMGSVFEAQRIGEAFDQRVALKIIRRGMDTPTNIARFNREQQILANLHHPNIAQLYDGGITDDGLPYLIMEYVEGTPINEYCNNQKFIVGERVKLFKQVCKAIQHAHKNLIIHRDLKPSNILVTNEGHVKILDFGISKILENDADAIHQTREQVRPVSLGYAAPEQLQKKSATTSVDTYGLGVLLYELLIGMHPFDFEEQSISEMEQIILHDSAPSPVKRFRNIDSQSKKEAIVENRSTTSAKLLSVIKGDLEAIILKLLLKDPNQRYGSTEELLSDLDRYQKSLPVKAQHNNVRYRVTKFVKRHQQKIVAATLLIGLFLGLIAFYTHKITQERNQAERETAKAEQISRFTLDIFESNNPAYARGDTITVRQVLKQAEEKIDNLDEEPLVKSRYMLHIGKVYYEIGQPFEAQEMLKEAQHIQEKYSEEPTMDQADILLHRGLLEFHFLENNDRAETFFNKSMDIAEQLSETDHISYFRNLEHLGVIQRIRGNFDSTKVLYDKAETGYEQHHKEKNHHPYQIISNRSLLEKYAGNLEKAEKSQRQFLEKQLDEYGEDHPSTINAMDNLASTLREANRHQEAALLFDRAFENAKQIWGKNSLEVASIQNGMGINLKKTGQYDSAETHYRKALQIRENKLGKDHPDVAVIYNNLATLNSARENYDATLRYHHKSLSIRKNWYGKNHLTTAHTFMNLGYLHKKSNQLDSALTYFERAHKIRKEKLPEDHPKYAESLYDLGAMYGKRKNWEKTEYYLRKALEIQQEKLDDTHPDLAKTYFAMGLLMEKTERYDKAKPYYRKVLDIREEIPGNDFTEYDNTAERLAEVFQKTGQQTEADSLLGT